MDYPPDCQCLQDIFPPLTEGEKVLCWDEGKFITLTVIVRGGTLGVTGFCGGGFQRIATSSLSRYKRPVPATINLNDFL